MGRLNLHRLGEGVLSSPGAFRARMEYVLALVVVQRSLRNAHSAVYLHLQSVTGNFY